MSSIKFEGIGKFEAKYNEKRNANCVAWQETSKANGNGLELILIEVSKRNTIERRVKSHRTFKTMDTRENKPYRAGLAIELRGD